MMGEWKGLDTGRMPVFLGYDQTERMIAALLDRAARWQPDAVVGIARGGLVPATMASLALGGMGGGADAGLSAGFSLGGFGSVMLRHSRIRLFPGSLLRYL